MNKKMVEEINVEAGTRLSRVRTFLGLTEEQMGEKLGVTAAVYQGFENGRRPLNARHLAAISTLSRWADPDYIVTGRFSLDFYIETAFRKMPDEELSTFKELMCSATGYNSGEDGTFDEKRALEACSGLIRYGMEHSHDADVRECGTVTVLTDMFNNMLAGKRES